MFKWNEPPTARGVHQKYVFFNYEPPKWAGDLKRADGFFDYTMTYRRDSDVVVPYFYFEKRDTPLSDKEWENVSITSTNIILF